MKWVDSMEDVGYDGDIMGFLVAIESNVNGIKPPLLVGMFHGIYKQLQGMMGNLAMEKGIKAVDNGDYIYIYT